MSAFNHRHPQLLLFGTLCGQAPQARLPVLPAFTLLVHGFVGRLHDHGSLDDGEPTTGSWDFSWQWMAVDGDHNQVLGICMIFCLMDGHGWPTP